MREYASLKTLRAGDVLDLGGVMLRMAEGEINSGDLYVAERNTGPKLLTAKEVTPRWIVPTSIDYVYNLDECVKVCEA